MKTDKFEPKKFKNKTALVLGAGKSGLSCAKLLAKQGFKVLLSETKKIKKPAKLPKNIEFENGGHSEKIFKCGFAVKSPGIASNALVIKKLKKAKIPVFSELETALSFCSNTKFLAVTGTNGKSTVTAMLGQIMQAAYGKNKVFTAGNIGTPISDIANKIKKDSVLVLETSSYQLEDSKFLKPNVSCILNITDDHIDHHGSMAVYKRAKERIFAFQNKQDFCIFNSDDRLCMQATKKCLSKKLLFSLKNQKSDAYHENRKIIFRFRKQTHKLNPPKLLGNHNIQNAMCAGLMALAYGINPKSIQRGFNGFKGISHRMEQIGSIKGIRFINDSKSTNVDSTLTALRALDTAKNIFLILGGLDKGSSYKPLIPLAKKSVKEVITIGSAAEKISFQLKKSVPIMNAKTLTKAVKYCFKNAKKGDICLLSPACASFDQFKNFEERGFFFKSAVLSMQKTRVKP